MTVVKPNIGAHAEIANNLVSFDEAYRLAVAEPDRTYQTTVGRVAFTVKATKATRGNHKSQSVLRFVSDRTERARAYPCCWGHRTNCSSTHIDIYTSAICPNEGELQYATSPQPRLNSPVVGSIVQSSTRDDFTEATRRVLAARVGNRCSNPNCQMPTSGPQDDPTKALNLGEAAHISAAAPGGPGYNPAQSAELRRHPDNGIWLCHNCHHLVDNDRSKYPEDLLRAWKTIAEHEAFSSLGKTGAGRPETESQRKLRAISPWQGKDIVLTKMNTGRLRLLTGRIGGRADVTLRDCNEHFITISYKGSSSSQSIPIANIEVSFDDRRKCLELQERLD